ncbi:Mu homology domain-containing protein [Kalaharituber pfeilii]|nr:Mu homology domain-containing protein [Kalaharituber pfeilii]
MSCIDALYIFDSFSVTPLLQYEWRRQSTPADILISAFNSSPTPRSSMLYIPTTTPPTLLFNITHNNLIFLTPVTSEVEPLLVLEFLHKVVDVLEDYFSSPLLPSKIENNYEVVAQLLAEMCDDGYPFTTEPNALRDLVVPPSLMGKIFGSVTGLPNTHLASSAASSSNANTLSAVPWRRSNVRHTNNELYVDIIEVVTATIAPSGRPLVARASGTIAMTSKISGVPDLLLTLSMPGKAYGQKLAGVEFPVFHPCVRLARWRERPGELSFVPPDGKFVLASYEVDLFPNPTYTTTSSKSTNLRLPVTVEVNKALGEYGNEFEVRVLINPSAVTSGSSTSSSSFRAIGSRGTNSPAFGGSSNSPVVDDVKITIPLAPGVKTLVNTKSSRGEWHHEKGTITWQVPMSGSGSAAARTATFRTGIILKAPLEENEDNEEDEEEEEADEVIDRSGGYDDGSIAPPAQPISKRRQEVEEARVQRRKAKLAAMMPRSVLISFAVKGWLASGMKVEGLQVVHGKGLGEGVKPYKGVKYLTKAGAIEVRC